MRKKKREMPALERENGTVGRTKNARAMATLISIDRNEVVKNRATCEKKEWQGKEGLIFKNGVVSCVYELRLLFFV